MSQPTSAKPSTGITALLAPIAAHGRSLAVLTVAGILSFKTGVECHSTIICTYPSAPFLPSLLRALVVWYWWAIVALVLWAWSSRSAKPLTLHPSMIFAQLAAGCMLAALHIALLHRTVILLSGIWPTWGHFFTPSGGYSGERFSIDLTIYTFIFISSSLIRSQVDARSAFMQRSELQRQLSQAQLQALQMQLEPHFLFNTLNSISSLVDLHRNNEASEAIAHLNTILRTALERGTPAKIPLHQEFKAIESYLAIQKMRFADRLEVQINTTPEALDGLVPSFLLQPIVENAIQHGIAPMKRGGILEASVRRCEDKLQVSVRDNGDMIAKGDTKGHGIGLRNTRERLKLFYPDLHTFRATTRTSGGFEVFIEIPYERLLT
jgi:hypothetical protein